VADEGVIESSAAELLRFRRHIGAERIQVWADVKKKHSAHAITADVDIGETAHAVEFLRGDAVIVTGAVTGDAPQRADLLAVKLSGRVMPPDLSIICPWKAALDRNSPVTSARSHWLNW